jgi:antitoxin PrlF
MLSTVTDKGQVTLPKAVRDQLGISPGSKLAFEVQADRTITVRLLDRGSAGLFGLLSRPGEASRSLAEMDAGVTGAVKQRSRKR